MNVPRVVHVAVAVIRDDAGRILVAQRLPHQHLAGLWEFPGGKVEPGETLFDGMRREIREELGIEVEALAPLLRIEHSYPEKTVLLDVWRVLRWSGPSPGACGAEGQPLRWVHPDDMIAAEFPPADVPIIAALRLPPYYVISPDLICAADIEAYADALVGLALPVRLLQVRLKRVPTLAASCVDALRARFPAATILLNSNTHMALHGSVDVRRHLCGADGLHLTASHLRACTARPDFMCAASCHDDAELGHAFRLGVDFAVLAPVLATASHPEAAALGWERFSTLAASAGLPVYALGGMQADMLGNAVSRGAVGIAGISFARG